MIAKPDLIDISPYFHDYLNGVKENDLLSALEGSRKATRDLIHSVSKDKEDFAYAEDKWTIKEVVRHIIDCERIYAYRALRFSRFDSTELAGFNENVYTTNLKKSQTSLRLLLEEYESVRQAGIFLFQSMTEDMLNFRGKANGMEVTARTLGFLTAGHNLHHCQVIKTKYLSL